MLFGVDRRDAYVLFSGNAGCMHLQWQLSHFNRKIYICHFFRYWYRCSLSIQFIEFHLHQHFAIIELAPAALCSAGAASFYIIIRVHRYARRSCTAQYVRFQFNSLPSSWSSLSLFLYFVDSWHGRASVVCSQTSNSLKYTIEMVFSLETNSI